MNDALKIAITHMRHATSGGVERYLNYIASYLADLGHDVTIICRSHKEKPHPRVNFIVLRPLSFGSAHRIKTFATAVEKHMKSHRYDIVYGLGRTYSQDVLRLSGGSHLTYLEKSHYLTHSRFLEFLSLAFLRHKVKLKIERKALTEHLPHKIICNSNMVKQDIMKRYDVPEERLVVIHNGTDIDRFNANNHRKKVEQFCEQLSLAETERILLFLGTGYKRKGLDLVMKAFAKYLQRKPQCK
jgi:UDP-glucose:(heptosyl)LPS alpha-1,3-glucosyltransferase